MPAPFQNQIPANTPAVPGATGRGTSGADPQESAPQSQQRRCAFAEALRHLRATRTKPGKPTILIDMKKKLSILKYLFLLLGRKRRELERSRERVEPVVPQPQNRQLALF